MPHPIFINQILKEDLDILRDHTHRYLIFQFGIYKIKECAKCGLTQKRITKLRTIEKLLNSVCNYEQTNILKLSTRINNMEKQNIKDRIKSEVEI